MLENQENIAQTLLDAGANAVQIRGINDGLPFVVVPEGYKVEDLENMMPNPLRKRANIHVSDADSFMLYLGKHSDPDASVIYAALDSEASKFSLHAILDDHGTNGTNWREHHCIYVPKLSVEWKRWTAKNGQLMNQSQFAAWLEDNLPDVANVDGMPTGTDILTMALGFEANADKRFRSKVNLQSGGVQFEFVDDEKNETRSTMKFFERFTLGIPVFDNSKAAYPVEARLKYRVKSEGLNFWFELVRPDRVFKTAADDELAAIKEGTGLMVINGTSNG